MLTASAYSNGDDVFLAWVLPETKNCRGVAISRELKRSGHTRSRVLDNHVGFAEDDAPPHSHRPSTEWPFQRYTWTDHDVKEGDVVSYTITPVMSTAAGLEPDASAVASVGPIKVTAGAGRSMHAFFNRGILLSQFVAKRLPSSFTEADVKKLVDDLGNVEDDLRAFLAGQLGERLLQVLDEAEAAGSHVYAALYELDDQALIARLRALGKRAHVILANGSARTRGGDASAAAAHDLENVVDLERRMLWSEGLGHNKFMVLAKSETEPVAVWTGSTNWQPTGLCTQMNNAILIDDPDLAGVYLEQWKRLRDDHTVGSNGHEHHFNPPLLEANDEPKADPSPANAWTVWFTRTTAAQDMEAATEVVNGAEDAILFLMFEPGSSGLLQAVQARLSPASPTYEPDLYVHGVVNTLKQARGGSNALAVDLVMRGANTSFDLAMVQPEGISGLAGWAKEVTRSEFLMPYGVVGHAIVHSKVLVIDPFTKPVVITGSHNFSHSASAKNDEDLVIVRDRQLAERYAVNVMGTYQHYRWRSYVLQCQQENRAPWSALRDDDAWQKKRPEHDRELAFWVRAAPGQAAEHELAATAGAGRAV